MSRLGYCYWISDLDEPGKGLVLVRANSSASLNRLPTDCSEFVGISFIRADNDYCGCQIGVGHFPDGEQILGRMVWSSSANWQDWKKIL